MRVRNDVVSSRISDFEIGDKVTPPSFWDSL